MSGTAAARSPPQAHQPSDLAFSTGKLWAAPAKHKPTLSPLWRNQRLLHLLYKRAGCLSDSGDNLLEQHICTLVMRWRSGSGPICNALWFVCSKYFTPHNPNPRQARDVFSIPRDPTTATTGQNTRRGFEMPHSRALLTSPLRAGSHAQWPWKLTQQRSHPKKTASPLLQRAGPVGGGRLNRVIKGMLLNADGLTEAEKE